MLDPQQQTPQQLEQSARDAKKAQSLGQLAEVVAEIARRLGPALEIAPRPQRRI